MSSLLPVVLLAGGLATRLRPLTEKIPKALVEINGEPFISHQLHLLKLQAVSEVIICAGYLGEMIEDFVGDGARFGLNVRYVFDGEKLLGTAGAIKKALPLLGEQFFVLYGDSYLICDYAEAQQIFLNSKKLALMTVYRNENLGDVSNVEFRNHTILVYDKKNRTSRMQHIDYGLGILNTKAFDLVPTDESYDLAMLYQKLVQQKQLAAYEVFERFYEVGSFGGIQDLETKLNN